MTIAELIKKLQSIGPDDQDAHVVVDIGHENYSDILDFADGDTIKDYDFAPDLEFDGEPLIDEETGDAYRKVLPIFIFHYDKR